MFAAWSVRLGELGARRLWLFGGLVVVASASGGFGLGGEAYFVLHPFMICRYVVLAVRD